MSQGQQESFIERVVRTEACGTCGAALGVMCKVEIRGRLHDGAHRSRIAAAGKGRP